MECKVLIVSSQSCAAELWRGTGGFSILAFARVMLPHILPISRPQRRDCAPLPGTTLCLLSPCLTAREKVGRGGGKGGAEGLNKTDQKALNFSPNTQPFND